MLEPVSYQHRLAVGSLNEIFQSIQLPVMEVQRAFVLGVDRAVCKLTEFPGKGCSIGCVHLDTLQFEHQLFGHRLVLLVFVLAERDRYGVQHTLRHLQIVGTSHGNRDVPDAPVDLGFCSRLRFIGEHLHTIPSVRGEEGIPVVCDEPPEALAHVQQAKLSPQIHEAIAGGCARQADEPIDQWAHLEQAFESLGLMAFE